MNNNPVLKMEQRTSKTKRITYDGAELPDEAVNIDDEYIDMLRPYDKTQIAIFGFLVFLFAAHITIIIWPLWERMSTEKIKPYEGLK